MVTAQELMVCVVRLMLLGNGDGISDLTITQWLSLSLSFSMETKLEDRGTFQPATGTYQPRVRTQARGVPTQSRFSVFRDEV